VAGIFHRESGTGPALVLIHGFCETSSIWDDFVPRLSSQFRVICPDLPGFGMSKMLPSGFSLSDVGMEMVKWLQTNGIVKPVVIGHSLGGYVTLAMANKGDLQLAGIGLFHSTALPDTEEKKVNRNKVIDFVNKNGVKPYIDTFVPGLFYDKQSPHIPSVNHLLNKADSSALTGYLAAMRDRPDQSVLLARFARPVLLLGGEHDEIIPAESLQKQAKSLQKGTLALLPDTGHMGMLESGEKSAREVAKFALSCQF
jgi:pimeloyl-ACP methyl ester carboxylesterase